MSEILRARDDLVRTIGPEADFYLGQTDGAIGSAAEGFGVFKVGGEMAQGEYIDQLGGAVGHLTRLGYFPVLIHGGGPQINSLFSEKGIEPEKIDGLRVTSPEALVLVEQALVGVNDEIRTSLSRQGVESEGMTAGFEAEIKDEDKWGLVGTPVGIDQERLRQIVEAGKVPVVACLGQTASGQTVNINGDDAAAQLVKELRPKNYISLTKPGGVLDSSGRIIPDLTEERAQELIEQGVIEGGMALKVNEILKLIGQGIRDDGVLAHPANVVRELFTHEGAGTLLTKDVAVQSYERLNGINSNQLRKLIEDAFGGHLAEGYFDLPDITRMYLTPQRYDGIGIVREPEGLDEVYMDKLAVAPGAQGRGIANSIINQIAADSKNGLFWRADPNAEFLSQYEEIADGSHHIHAPDGREWRVFFKGVPGEQLSSAALEWAASQPVTIQRHKSDSPF